MDRQTDQRCPLVSPCSQTRGRAVVFGESRVGESRNVCTPPLQGFSFCQQARDLVGPLPTPPPHPNQQTIKYLPKLPPTDTSLIRIARKQSLTPFLAAAVFLIIPPGWWAWITSEALFCPNHANQAPVPSASGAMSISCWPWAARAKHSNLHQHPRHHDAHQQQSLPRDTSLRTSGGNSSLWTSSVAAP